MESLTAINLIIVSAFMHALWNFMLKGVKDKVIAIWWAMLLAPVILLPYFLWQVNWQELPGLNWGVITASGFLKAIYFILLGYIYQHGDLSLGYPLARSANLFTPFVAFLLINETIGQLEWLGIIIITIGIFMLHIKDRQGNFFSNTIKNLRHKTSLIALGTALIVAFYSVLDKVGVTGGSAFTFMYLMFAVSLLPFTAFIFATNDKKTIKKCFQKHWPILISIGLLDWGGYFLVLLAMQLTAVSQVVAIRQISILFGVLLGGIFYKEKNSLQRAIGAIIICLGVWLVT